MGAFLTNDDEEGSNCLETEVALATDVALPSLLQGFYFKLKKFKNVNEGTILSKLTYNRP